MKRSTHRQSGFSLLETLVVVGVMTVLAGLALVNTTNTLQNYRADSALDIVTTQLKVARQTAISNRSNVTVAISSASSGPDMTQTITFQQQAKASGGAVPPATVAYLPKGVQFVLEPGVPDTPMAFGNLSAIYIGNTSGGPPVMQFNADGSFTDNALSPLNGTIFLGIPNTAPSARAVTILGGTGRIRPYGWKGTQWTE